MYAKPVILAPTGETKAELDWIAEVRTFARGMDLKLIDAQHDVGNLAPLGRFQVVTMSTRWGHVGGILASSESIEDVTKVLQLLAYGERYGFASAIDSHEITNCKCDKCEAVREEKPLKVEVKTVEEPVSG